jgi:hypothetical protein
MIILLICLAVEPEIKIGAFFPQVIAGQGELGSLYHPSAAVYLSRQEFSFGFYGDGFLKKTDPYSNQYFRGSNSYAAIRAAGIGAALRWRFFWFATGKVGGGYYFGDIDRTVADSAGGVLQLKDGRRSLGVFMAWDLYTKLMGSKLGGEFKINYAPFGGKIEERPVLQNLDPFRGVSLIGVGLSLMVCL